MKFSLWVAATAALWLWASVTEAAKTRAKARTKAQSDPLEMVLSMMDDLTAKLNKEQAAEDKAYHEFFEWCDDTSKNTNFEIKTSSAKKEELISKLDKLAADIQDGTVKIEELVASIAKDTKELKAATKIREEEQATFEAEAAELVGGIDTLERAIGIIEKGMQGGAAASGAALTQVNPKRLDSILKALGTVMDAAAVDSMDQRNLQAFIQRQGTKQKSEEEEEEEEDSEALGAPAASATEAKGGGILDVLEEMKEKAEEELDALRKDETTAKNNYAMLKQSLETQMKAETKEKADEEAARAAASEETSTAQGELEVTSKALAEALKELEVNNNNCMQTATDKEISTKGRVEELKAIADAKKILVEATGGASALQKSAGKEEDDLDAPADPEDGDVSLFQLKSHSGHRAAFRQKVSAKARQKMHEAATREVVRYIKQIAHKYGNKALVQLASRIQAALRLGRGAGNDPFAKTKTLVTDMIAKLEKEAKEDATEKAYCDEQMEKTGEKKDALDTTIEQLTSKIDKAASASTELKAAVKVLQSELATLLKEQNELDKIRKEQNADYMLVKKDLVKALDGVRKALDILRKYYGKAAAAAMIETGDNSEFDAAMEQPKMPEMHASAGGAGGGVISMLEVIESDFAKGLAKAEKMESDSQEEYDTTSAENERVKATKMQDVKYKTQEFIALDKMIANHEADRDTTNEELQSVMKYFGKIKDRCIAKPIPYEEIKKRRDKELDGLKQSLTVLDGSSFAQVFEQGDRRSEKKTRQHFLS